MDERYKNFDDLLEKYNLTLEERIGILVRLGDVLDTKDEHLDVLIQRSYIENKWFTEENQRYALASIRNFFLDEKKLTDWIAKYPDLTQVDEMKAVGIIMAGNIPLVGFHDFLCVFVAGHKAKIKLSDKDKHLLPYLLKKMSDIDARVKNHYEIIEKLTDFQAVIATGSNNTARYFDAYFSKYPNIIRKNRNSIAVLDGSETDDDLMALGHDIFDYFGLGCRNVSKIYVPQDYDVNRLLELWHEQFKELVLHDKYKNNFDYNYALFMLNRVKFQINGCLILMEDKSLSSRIASLHYERYENTKILENELLIIQEQLQCVSTWVKFPKLKTVPIGATQKPTLMDYPDDVDVMEWLVKLDHISSL